MVVAGDRRTAPVIRKAPIYSNRGGGDGCIVRQARLDRRLAPVVDVEGDVDRVFAPVAVVGLHRHRETGVRLVAVVLADFGPDLAGAGNDVELRGVGPFERVRQGVVVVVGCGHLVADIRRRRDDLVADALVEVASRRLGGEFRRVGGRARPRRRPVAVPVRVRRPYLYLVGGVLRHACDRRTGAGDVLRSVRPGAARPLPVAEVVTGNRGAVAVVRRGPAHVEARGASRGHRRRRRRHRRRPGGG